MVVGSRLEVELNGGLICEEALLFLEFMIVSQLMRDLPAQVFQVFVVGFLLCSCQEKTENEEVLLELGDVVDWNAELRLLRSEAVLGAAALAVDENPADLIQSVELEAHLLRGELRMTGGKAAKILARLYLEERNRRALAQFPGPDSGPEPEVRVDEILDRDRVTYEKAKRAMLSDQPDGGAILYRKEPE